MNYAEKLIRGISNADFIDSEGRATAMLFQFDNVNTRQDGFGECSINWYDNEEALKLLLEQKKREDENIYQFKTGGEDRILIGTIVAWVRELTGGMGLQRSE